MAYLLPAEYEAYGLTAETAGSWVEAASAMVDAHCRRKSLGVEQFVERLRVRPERQTAWLSYLPVVEIASVRARYARAGGAYAWGDEVCRVFGLSGEWVDLDASTTELNAETGEVQLPVSVLGQSFSEVEVTYTSGFADVPAAVKTATAQLVRNAQAMPALNVKSSKMDAMQMEYFAGSLMDDATRAMLRPYVAGRLG